MGLMMGAILSFLLLIILNHVHVPCIWFEVKETRHSTMPWPRQHRIKALLCMSLVCFGFAGHDAHGIYQKQLLLVYIQGNAPF